MILHVYVYVCIVGHGYTTVGVKRKKFLSLPPNFTILLLFFPKCGKIFYFTEALLGTYLSSLTFLSADSIPGYGTDSHLKVRFHF